MRLYNRFIQGSGRLSLTSIPNRPERGRARLLAIVAVAVLVALGYAFLELGSSTPTPHPESTQAADDPTPGAGFQDTPGIGARPADRSAPLPNDPDEGASADGRATRRSPRPADWDPSRQPPGAAARDQRRWGSDEVEERTAPSEIPSSPLSGRALDEDGRPVPAIEVLAEQRLLTKSADSSPRSGHETARATTGPDGEFEFARLAEGEYRIRTRETDRYAAAEALARAGVASLTLVLKQRRESTVRVFGTVSDHRAEPLSGVRIQADGLHAGPTDARGAYSLNLPLGRGNRIHSLRFTRRGHRDETRQLRSDQLAAGGEEVRLDVALRPNNEPAPIAGTVLTTSGDPILGAVVRLFSGETGRRHQTVTDRSGRFLFPEVESETEYAFRVKGENRFLEHVQQGLWLPKEGLTLPVVLESAEFGSISGRMVDAAGNAIPQFALWMRTSSSSDPFKSVVGDARGRFLVEQVPQGPVTFLTLSEPRFAVNGLEATPGRRTEVDVILDWGVRQIDGRVVDGSGQAIAGAELTLSWSLEAHGVRSRSSRTTISDRDGRFTLTRIGPGAHTLSARAIGFQAARIEVGGGSRGTLIRLQPLPF